MKSFALLLISLLIAVWMSTIALVAVQNADSVSLKFLSFQSIALPFGLVLAFSTGIGVLGAALLLPLLGFAASNQPEEE